MVLHLDVVLVIEVLDFLSFFDRLLQALFLLLLVLLIVLLFVLIKLLIGRVFELEVILFFCLWDWLLMAFILRQEMSSMHNQLVARTVYHRHYESLVIYLLFILQMLLKLMRVCLLLFIMLAVFIVELLLVLVVCIDFFSGASWILSVQMVILPVELSLPLFFFFFDLIEFLVVVQVFSDSSGVRRQLLRVVQMV